MWPDHHGASQDMLGISPLTIETHCLPSSIFIEHLQCTRHNRTYRRHCPCSWGAYILRKNTPLVEWHFCLVFSVKDWGNTRWGVSSGCDLAPSLLERRRKDFKGRRWQTIQGRVSREINTSSTEELGCRRGWGEAVGCKQRKEVGILDTEWSQKDHAAFSQIHGHQVGMVGDKTVKGKRACARHGNRGLESQTGRL